MKEGRKVIEYSEEIFFLYILYFFFFYLDRYIKLRNAVVGPNSKNISKEALVHKFFFFLE